MSPTEKSLDTPLVKAIANSKNNSVSEFKKYFKGIIVSDFHEDIQETITYT